MQHDLKEWGESPGRDSLEGHRRHSLSSCIVELTRSHRPGKSRFQGIRRGRVGRCPVEIESKTICQVGLREANSTAISSENKRQTKTDEEGIT